MRSQTETDSEFRIMAAPLDLSTAVNMARAAYVMYGKRALPIGNKQIAFNLSEVSEIVTRRVSCRVGYWQSNTRASVVVAFRGSSNGSEWLNNAHPAVWQKGSPTTVGKLHPGFSNSFEEIWDDVASCINVLVQSHLSELLTAYSGGQCTPISFTGHSRGGALAVLAGLRGLTTFLLPVSVYTFGAPRVGDRDFAQSYADVFAQADSTHWRFECVGDPVPVFPFALEGTHTGKLVMIDPKSQIVQVVVSEPHAAIRAAHSVSLKPSRPHKMSNYLRVLAEAVAVG